MKNKNKKIITKQGIRGDIVVIFMLSIMSLLLVLSFIFGIIIPGLQEPHFKIYEKKCRNESITNVIYPRYCESFDFEIKSFNILEKGIDEYALESYLCYEEVKGIENESEKILIRKVGGNNYNKTREVMCEYVLSHFEEGQRIDSYRNFTIFEYKPENFEGLFLEDLIKVDNDTICNNNKFYGVYIEIIYNEKICEQVEVDEIDLGEYEEFNFRNGEILTCFNKCYFKGEIDENFSGFIQPKRREEYDIIKYEKKKRVISKQDLIIEWLDENCEIARCTPCEDLDCKNQECNLYSCGNYIVEVEK